MVATLDHDIRRGNMEQIPECRTLRDREAAIYIGMSESWLRQARMNGNPDAPPFVKIGRAVRYLRDDLDTWLESRRRTSSVIGSGHLKGINR